jgi:4-amino-4-deoxy-L-arabinose transferase-like glycosyltransferase
MPSKTSNNHRPQQWTWLLLLLVLFATRLWNLPQLPLHNDEGLHLTRAVAVWSGHPFWDITDGKIINHWLIAAFYPQNAPDFVARIATVFVGMLGAAAGYATARHLAGYRAGILAIGLWVLSPYLFFYERLAQSDAEAAAMVMVAVWGCLRSTKVWTWRFTLWTGGALALAALMKFTAAPYALVIGLLIFVRGQASLGRRFGHLLGIGLIGIVAFLPPMLYMGLQGQGFFAVALDWVTSTTYGQMTLVEKFMLWLAQLTQFGAGSWLWFGVFSAGFLAYLVFENGENRLLLVIALLPLIMIVVLRQWCSRVILW